MDENQNKPPSAAALLSAQFRVFVRENPFLTVMCFVALLFVPVQEILVPQLTGRIVDSVRTKAGRERDVMRTVYLVILVMGLVQSVTLVDDWVEALMQPRIQSFFSEQMLERVLANSETDLSPHRGTGDVMAQFVKMPTALADFFDTAKHMIPHLLAYLFAIVYFSVVDWGLGAGMVALVLLVFGAMVFTGGTCGDASQARDGAQNMIQEQVDEVIRNMSAVHAVHMGAAEMARLRDMQVTYRSSYARSAVCAMWLKVFMVPITLAALVGAMLRSNALVRRGRMTVGTFTSVFLVVMYLADSLLRIIRYYRQLLFQWGVLKSGAGVMSDTGTGLRPRASQKGKEKEKKKDGFDSERCLAGSGSGSKSDSGSDSGRRVGAQAHSAQAHSAQAHSAQARHIVSLAAVRVRDIRIDFRLREGERVAVVGPIASGKSTLLAILMRFTLPSSFGEMTLFGRPYTSYSVREVRELFGYVPQTTSLFNRSVFENITYGAKRKISEAEVWRRAAEMGIEAKLREIHGGNLRSSAQKGGAGLSGGQRQVVWLMRMALRQPRVLLLDEPTSALDDETAALISAAIKRFPTSVMVTHDERLLKAAATRVWHADGDNRK